MAFNGFHRAHAIYGATISTTVDRGCEGAVLQCLQKLAGSSSSCSEAAVAAALIERNRRIHRDSEFLDALYSHQHLQLQLIQPLLLVLQSQHSTVAADAASLDAAAASAWLVSILSELNTSQPLLLPYLSIMIDTLLHSPGPYSKLIAAVANILWYAASKQRLQLHDLETLLAVAVQPRSSSCAAFQRLFSSSRIRLLGHHHNVHESCYRQQAAADVILHIVWHKHVQQLLQGKLSMLLHNACNNAFAASVAFNIVWHIMYSGPAGEAAVEQQSELLLYAARNFTQLQQQHYHQQQQQQYWQGGVPALISAATALMRMLSRHPGKQLLLQHPANVASSVDVVPAVAEHYKHSAAGGAPEGRAKYQQAIWELNNIAALPAAAAVLTVPQRLQQLLLEIESELQLYAMWWLTPQKHLLHIIQQLMHSAAERGIPPNLQVLQQVATWLKGQIGTAHQLRQQQQQQSVSDQLTAIKARCLLLTDCLLPLGSYWEGLISLAPYMNLLKEAAAVQGVAQRRAVAAAAATGVSSSSSS